MRYLLILSTFLLLSLPTFSQSVVQFSRVKFINIETGEVSTDWELNNVFIFDHEEKGNIARRSVYGPLTVYYVVDAETVFREDRHVINKYTAILDNGNRITLEYDTTLMEMSIWPGGNEYHLFYNPID
jgi:hypothetical protein